MKRLTTALLVLWLVGCDDDPPVPPPPARDAGPSMDAGPPGGVPRDAGPPLATIDGVIDDEEWAGADTVTLERDTDRPGTVLRRLLAQVEPDRLVVAVDGTIAAGDTLVVYIDRALDEGVGVADLSTIDDTDGALDAALANGPSTPAGFAADFAFGTDAMPRIVAGLDAGGGWRDLSDPSDLTWLTGEEAPMACAAEACEAAIPLSTLGGEAPRTIALFARVVSGAGGYTNQTLPEDADPAVVTNVLRLSDVEDTDAGMPDAGVPDAGPEGVVVDGVLSSGEWDAAMRFTQSTPAAGSFVGSSLDALYAIRTSDRLFVAVEATLNPGNALAVYVDRDLFGIFGLASPTPLDDTLGDLDRALSRPMFTPAEVLIDHAWGTLDMGRGAVAFDDRMGWRDVGTTPDDFRPFDVAMAPTVCGANVCETSIALSDLSVGAADSIGLYARLVSATSAAFSNQTLPLDDPAAPELISVYVQLDP